MRTSAAASRRERRARARPARERSLRAAAGWSALVTVLVGFGVALSQWMQPGTPLRNLLDLELLNRQVAPGNPLFVQFLGQVQTQEALYFTPLAVLCGGLALGRLAPRAAGRRATMKAAAFVALAVLLACLALSWGETLYAQQGHLRAREIDRELVLVQGGLLLGWTGVYLLGTRLGLWWRDRRRSPAAPDSDPPAWPPTPARRPPADGSS